MSDTNIENVVEKQKIMEDEIVDDGQMIEEEKKF
jgi:hypothetical protein